MDHHHPQLSCTCQLQQLGITNTTKCSRAQTKSAHVLFRLLYCSLFLLLLNSFDSSNGSPVVDICAMCILHTRYTQSVVNWWATAAGCCTWFFASKLQWYYVSYERMTQCIERISCTARVCKRLIAWKSAIELSHQKQMRDETTTEMSE